MFHYNRFLVPLKLLARRLFMSAPPDLGLVGIFDEPGSRLKHIERDPAHWAVLLGWAVDKPALCVKQITHWKKNDLRQHEYIEINVVYRCPDDGHVYERTIYADRDFTDGGIERDEEGVRFFQNHTLESVLTNHRSFAPLERVRLLRYP
jgi:hypothetical protein